MLLSALHLDIIQAFESMMKAAEVFANQIVLDHHLPSWISDLSGGLVADRARARDIYLQFEYEDEQMPRETVMLPGLIAVGEGGILAAQALNEAKMAFKRAVLTLKQAKLRLSMGEFDAEFNRLLSRQSMVRSGLRRTGFRRLHLKQCYRQISILPTQPVQVSWTWTHTRSVQKISLMEAESRLMKKGQDAGISMQLAKLRTLRAGTKLAIVQELSPHLCGNVLGGAADPRARFMMKSPMPMIYCHDAEKPTPMVKAPTLCREKNTTRRRRSDVRIADDPFLPAIRAHLYLDS